MPRGVSRARQLAEKARQAALEAVAAYNNPLASFKSDTYVVLMHVAWTTLLHAIFFKRHIKPYHRKRGSNRFERIDGRPRTWELPECIRRYWPGQTNAVTENLAFFSGLRDLIEHAHAPELDIDIFGECQAMLLNFEELITQQFGERYALNTSLAFSLQFSRVREPEAHEAMRQLLRRAASTDLRAYIDDFRSSLTDEIAGDMAYSYKVFLVPVLANHRTRETLAVEFVHYDPENMDDYDRAVALIRQRIVPVINPGRLKPSQVVEQVAPRIAPKTFNVTTHTRCWKYWRVRPRPGSAAPALCETRFCQYDEPHGDYLYTEEWVDFLVSQLTDDETYAAMRSGRQAAIELPSATA